MPRPSHLLCYLLPFLTLMSSGCRVSGLAFVEDRRVEILTPKDGSTVRLPLSLAWKVQDFKIEPPDGQAHPDAGYFAILIDRSPMPPGENLTYFAQDDPSCLRRRGCPDETYLKDRHAYLTTETSFRVETLPDFRPTGSKVKDRHEVTIVLLDGQSKRIGESAFIVSFVVDRGSS